MPTNRTVNWDLSQDPRLTTLKAALKGGVKESVYVTSKLQAWADSTRHNRLFLELAQVVAPIQQPLKFKTPLTGLTYNTQVAKFAAILIRRYEKDGAVVIDECQVAALDSNHNVVTDALGSLSGWTMGIPHMFNSLPDDPAKPTFVPLTWVDEGEYTTETGTINIEGTTFPYVLHEAAVKFTVKMNGQVVYTTDPDVGTGPPDKEIRKLIQRQMTVDPETGETTVVDKVHVYQLWGLTSQPLTNGTAVEFLFNGAHDWEVNKVPLYHMQGYNLIKGYFPNLNLPDIPGDATGLDEIILCVHPQSMLGFDGLALPTDTFQSTLSLPLFAQTVNQLSIQGTVANAQYRAVEGETVSAWKDLNVPHTFTQDLSMKALEVQVQLVQSGQIYFGFTADVTERDRFQDYTPPPNEMGGLPPADWKEPTYEYRASVNSPYIQRHPDMNATMTGIKAFDATGNPATVQRYGDYLLFGGSGPWTVYFQRLGGALMVPTITRSSFELFVAAHPLSVIPAWGAAERYERGRNVVTPSYTVMLGNIDVSEHLVEFSPDSVTLAGPASNLQSLPENVSRVNVTSGVLPITAGVTVRVDTQPYANGRKIQLSYIPVSRFLDVDLNAINLPESQATTEEDHVLQIMQLALKDPGGEHIKKTAGVQFRKLDFWTQEPPHGPGLVIEEVYSRYWNTQMGSSLSEIRSLLNANMLDMFDLPNGDVLISTLVPSPEKDLKEILNSTGTVKYNTDQQGNFINDPRLDVTSITLAFDEGFSRIEVEGFSNEVLLDATETFATFVQNQKDTKEYYIYVPGYTGNSDFTGNKFYFTTFRKNFAEAMVYPKLWFTQANMDFADNNLVQIVNVSHSWGSLGSGWASVERKGLIRMTGNEILASTNPHWAKLKEPNPEYENKPHLVEFLDRFLTPSGDPIFSSPAARLEHPLAVGVDLRVVGDWVSSKEVWFKAKVGAPDEATLKVHPLVGEVNTQFAPNWFPPNYMNLVLYKYENLKPRKAKRIQNQYIARIGQNYAVQVPNFPDNRITPAMYNVNEKLSAQQLATYLTLREILGSRTVQLSYAGTHTFTPNQFVAIARRPENGVGHPVEKYDILLVLEIPSADARVGSEAWTRVRCAYVGCLDVNDPDNPEFDMPVGWGVSWE